MEKYKIEYHIEFNSPYGTSITDCPFGLGKVGNFHDCQLCNYFRGINTKDRYVLCSLKALRTLVG